MNKRDNMSKQVREEELKIKYEKFITTEEGIRWRKRWQEEISSDSCGDFGDYLYGFYPEMLQ